MNFLYISILAYCFNAVAIVIDKILINRSIPNPIVYTVYISLLQLSVILLVPFGFTPTFDSSLFLAAASGVVNFFAFYSFFTSLKTSEASIVGPVVGALNPLFALLIGELVLHQTLTTTQYVAFFILILGAALITFNVWFGKIKHDEQLIWLLAAGFLFAVSYVLLREAFLKSSFIDGIIISRVAIGTTALFFLIFPFIRRQVFASKLTAQNFINRTSLLLLSGQSMGALSGLLLAFGVYLTSPALVNAIFGVQYLVILAAAIVLSKSNPSLLEEKLTKAIILQKLTGAVILSIGLYFLTL